MTDLQALAGKLTEAQREALLTFSGDWSAGPRLPDVVFDHLKPLRSAGLLEREFGDFRPVERSVSEDSIAFRMSACWHFRLTPLGLALRDHLLSKDNQHG